MPPKSRNGFDVFNTICRICAREDTKVIPIFGQEGKKQNLLKKIGVCLPITICENDIYPKQICLSCLSKLEDYWNYHVLCRETQVKLEKKMVTLRSQENVKQENCTPKPEDINCGKCNVEVIDNGVGCEGPCLKWFHIACIKMSEEAYYRLCDNPKECWICKKCKKKVPLPKIDLAPPIEERLKNLTESHPIPYGPSAKICLAPVATPPPSSCSTPATRDAQVIPQSVAAGSVEPVMVPVTYFTPGSAPSAASDATPPVSEDVYPQALIQVSQNPIVEQPALYQNRPAPAPVPASTPSPAPQSVSRRRQIQMPATMPSNPPRPIPTPLKRQNGEISNGPQAKKQCRYCSKFFTDDIIDHHVSLHLRQTFTTCLDCNKNFRSEEAMERHRCGANEPIDLDADDEPIVL